MIKVSQDTMFDECITLSFDYCKFYVMEVKHLNKRRYIPETHEWRILKKEFSKLVRRIGIYNFSFSNDELRYELCNKNIKKKEDDYLKHLANIRLNAPFSFKLSPLPHQIEAFNYGISHDKFIIADEMGLGKTMESLTVAVFRKNIGQIKKCLIVCGDNSTKYNWASEINKHTNEKVVIFDQKSKQKRIKMIDEWALSDTFFGIINIEQLRCSEITKKQISSFISGKTAAEDIPMNEITMKLNSIAGMCIADEIHKMKNANSKQGLSLQSITCKYKIGLSGTPLTNHIEDLWNILKWLNSIDINYWEFRNTYCLMGGYESKEVVGYKKLDQLAATLQQYMIRRTKKMVLNLPEKLYKTEYVMLPDTTKSIYENVRQGIVLKLTEDLKVKRITIQNALTRMLRLRQLTEGINATDDGNIEILSKNPKLERVKDILENNIISNGKKALIFTSWEKTASLYRDALINYNPAYIVGKVSPEERQKQVERFQNDPNCHIAIGTIGAMGTGLTMTAAEYVFFIDKFWNQTDNLQAEDRAHRIGSKNNVTIISMVAKDTIDEKIEELLKTKQSLFDQIVNGEAVSANNTNNFVMELLK